MKIKKVFLVSVAILMLVILTSCQEKEIKEMPLDIDDDISYELPTETDKKEGNNKNLEAVISFNYYNDEDELLSHIDTQTINYTEDSEVITLKGNNIVSSLLLVSEEVELSENNDYSIPVHLIFDGEFEIKFIEDLSIIYSASIIYIDLDGKELRDSEINNLELGKLREIEAPEIDGYRFYSSEKTELFANKSSILTFVYEPL